MKDEKKTTAQEMSLVLNDRQKKAFFSKIDKSKSGDECWIWTGARMPKGYGAVNINRRVYRAHRVSYCMINGGIPNKMLVLHSCDNPPCCNPAHLFLGTEKKNSEDMVNKGRTNGPAGARHKSVTMPWTVSRGDSHCMRIRPEIVPRGVRNFNAKLNDDKVRQIREMHGAGVGFDVMSEMFGVHKVNIRMAAIGRSWKHVK